MEEAGIYIYFYRRHLLGFKNRDDREATDRGVDRRCNRCKKQTNNNFERRRHIKVATMWLCDVLNRNRRKRRKI